MKWYYKYLIFSLICIAVFVFMKPQKAYARELSKNDIANSIYNIDKALNNVELTKNDINLSVCEFIANTFNTHQGKYCIFQRNIGTIEFSYFNGKVYMANNSPQCASGAYSIRYNLQTKQFIENSFINATTDAYGTYTYNDCIIYTANNSNNIYWNANTMRPRGFNMFEEVLFTNEYFNFDYPQTLISRTYDTNIKFYAVGIESNTTLTDLKLQDEQGNYYGGINQFITIYEEEENNSYQLWLYSENAPNIYKKYRAVAIKDNEIKATTDYTLQLRYLKSGTITNESGETTGNINLEPINNNLENINNKIENQTQAIISGDNKIIQAIESGEKKAEERQSFWEKAYNNLFYVSGEEIENKITKLYNELELPSGEVSGELAGLDVIKENPRRFYNIVETSNNTFYIKK